MADANRHWLLRFSMQTFEADLADLQPSQLYVSEKKLAEIERELGECRPMKPVPVKLLGGRRVLTDGHTRAFAAFRRGDRTIPAFWETDELDWEAYQICVGWCLEAGIGSVADLVGRVLTSDDYKRLWLDRCRAMHVERSRGDELAACAKEESKDE